MVILTNNREETDSLSAMRFSGFVFSADILELTFCERYALFGFQSWRNGVNFSLFVYVKKCVRL